MKFLINRASGLEPPCDKAVRVERDSEFSYNDHFWMIEVNSLDELLPLAELDRDGIIVSHTRDYQKDETGIEWGIMIYDSYIE